MRRTGLGVALTLVAAVALAGSGCGRGKEADPAQDVLVKKEHDHSGWWCTEHGIPEEECSLCSAKVARECKAKGDWCSEHRRAKSQCFKCDPKLKEPIQGELLKIPEVRSVSEVTGRFDMIVTVHAHTLEELHNVVIERIGKIEGIQNTETFVEMQRTDKEPTYTA